MAMTQAYERLKALHSNDKGKGKAREIGSGSDEDIAMHELEPEVKQSWRDIEQAMPVNAVAYADESLEAFCRGTYVKHDSG